VIRVIRGLMAFLLRLECGGRFNLESQYPEERQASCIRENRIQKQFPLSAFSISVFKLFFRDAAGMISYSK
jgi:hypothetical protein